MSAAQRSILGSPAASTMSPSRKNENAADEREREQRRQLEPEVARA